MKNNIRLLMALTLIIVSLTAFAASKNHTGIINNSALIYPEVYSSDETGSATDVSDYKGAMVTALVGSGTFSTTNSVKVKLQHSASSTAGTFEAVSAGDIIGVTPDSDGSILTLEAATNEDKIVNAAYIGGEKYIRVILDASGTITATAAVVLTESMPYIAQ